jgi:tetratricopeptide (TPR) repeat protein
MRTRTIPFVLITLAATTLTAFAQRTLPDARERARAPYNIALEQWKIEAWDDAEKSFKAAIDIDPTFEMAYYMLGRTHMNQKRYPDAAGAYEKSRALYQQENGRQYTDAQERQRRRDTRLRDIDDVIRTYQGAQQTQQVLNAIRQLENEKRLTQEAMSRGNSTMTLGAGVPAYVSMALGSAYFRMGNLAGAEREYKAAVLADPKAGEAHNNLAVVYMETGRLTEADKCVQAAEKVGFKVNPQLKEEIKNRRKAGTQ